MIVDVATAVLILSALFFFSFLLRHIPLREAFAFQLCLLF
jgi:hypothetical protein